jgi:hypothetical protein
MQEIGIGACLAEINSQNNQNTVFVIGFVTKEGLYREIQAKKGIAENQQKSNNPRKKQFHNINQHRLLKLLDTSDNKPKNIKYDLIIFYNGKRVRH